MKPSSSIHNDVASEQAADWCIRLHEENCTIAERDVFNEWIKSAPNNAFEYEKILKIWNLSTQLSPTASAMQHAAKPQHFNWPLFTYIMSFTLLLLPIAGYTGWMLDWVPNSYHRYASEQSLQHITLPDGSDIELNLNTRLSFANYRHQRRVNLTQGEAYFHVAHDNNHPFVVSAASGKITVTGTRFNVWKYQDNVAVAVMEGSVVVRSGQADRNLTSGLQAKFNGTHLHPHLSDINTSQVLAWREGQLILDNLTLSEAVPQINRYLEKPLILSSQSVAELRIGGIYNTNDIQRLVEVLPEILPVKLKQRKDGSIQISKRSSSYYAPM